MKVNTLIPLLSILTLAVASSQAQSSADPQPLILQARERIAANDPEAARKLLTQALAISPNSPEANLTLGSLDLDRHRYPEAMERFETVLAIDLRSPTARQGELAAAVALALEAKRSGNPEAALLCLQHARKSLPDDPTLLHDLGVQAETMNLLPVAEEALTAALALVPDDPANLYALARVETARQSFPSAERHFRAYLATHPTDASAHYGLAHLLQMQQRTGEAAQEFHRSITLQPIQTESYYQLGQMALDAHQDGEAAPLFQKTLTRSPTHGGALTGLGIIAFRAKDYQAAAKYLTEATTATPDYQPAHYYLGLTLGRLIDKSGSQRELDRAIELANKQQGKSAPIASSIAVP